MYTLYISVTEQHIFTILVPIPLIHLVWAVGSPSMGGRFKKFEDCWPRGWEIRKLRYLKSTFLLIHPLVELIVIYPSVLTETNLAIKLSDTGQILQSLNYLQMNHIIYFKYIWNFGNIKTIWEKIVISDFYSCNKGCCLCNM